MPAHTTHVATWEINGVLKGDTRPICLFQLTWIASKVSHKPWRIEQLSQEFGCCLLDQVRNLSGGELQRVAITLCLGKPADVYLIDEPSAYLDSEQRLHAAKVIKRSVHSLWTRGGGDEKKARRMYQPIIVFVTVGAVSAVKDESRARDLHLYISLE